MSLSLKQVTGIVGACAAVSAILYLATRGARPGPGSAERSTAGRQQRRVTPRPYTGPLAVKQGRNSRQQAGTSALRPSLPAAVARGEGKSLPPVADDPGELPGAEEPGGDVLSATDETLMRALRSAADPFVREEIAVELKYRGSPRAYEAFVFLLFDDDPDVRILAAQYLEELGDARAVPSLERARAEEKVSEVSDAIRQALSRLLRKQPAK